MNYKDDLHDLKRSFKPGQLFGVSDVQRKMVWGYNRVRNTIDMGLANKDIEEVSQDNFYMRYQFV